MSEIQKMSFWKIFLRIFFAICIWIIIFPFLASFFFILIQQIFPKFILRNSWSEVFFVDLGIFIFSFCLIWILSRGKISSYGFRKPTGFQLKYYILLGLGLPIITNVAMLFFPKEPFFTDDFSFVLTVFLIWILTPITLEIFYRGLIQTFLKNLSQYDFSISKIRISLPVLITAFLFSASHSMLFFSDKIKSHMAILILLIATFFLGLVAGYYREKTKSLLPGILLVICFNIIGNVFHWLSLLF